MEARQDQQKLRQLIKDYLGEAKLMQIATVKDQRPWVATVWYTSDSDFNMYFISRKSRRHSVELKSNPNVAGAIVKPHIVGSGEKVRGLQFEGRAEECLNDKLMTALELYLNKYDRAEKIPLEQLQDKNFIATFYVVRPSSFILFDEINFPEEPRQELKLG